MFVKQIFNEQKSQIGREKRRHPEHAVTRGGGYEEEGGMQLPEFIRSVL